MNVRELIEVLGAGDLEAEVYVTGDGRTFRPVTDVDEVFVDDPAAIKARFGKISLPAAILWPPDDEERDENPPLVRTGQGDFTKDYPASPSRREA